MQRVEKERGALAVVVALLMVPLIGFAAISIDVAALHAERQQLQIGADAAALAVAQQCAEAAGTSCGDYMGTANTFAVANAKHGDAVATILTPSLSPNTGEVTVRAAGTSQHWFAPVLNEAYTENKIFAEATASWMARAGGNSLPIAMSLCEIQRLVNASDPTFIFNSATNKFESAAPTGNPVEISLPHPSEKDPAKTGCIPSGSPHYIPAGFGWITDSLAGCEVYTEVGKNIGSDTGNSRPSACTDAYLKGLVDAKEPVAIPIFNEAGGTGSGGYYKVYGYVGFRLTGFEFNGSKNYKYGASCDAKGGTQCIVGIFENLVDLNGIIKPGAPDLGVSSVRLTK